MAAPKTLKGFPVVLVPSEGGAEGPEPALGQTPAFGSGIVPEIPEAPGAGPIPTPIRGVELPKPPEVPQPAAAWWRFAKGVAAALAALGAVAAIGWAAARKVVTEDELAAHIAEESRVIEDVRGTLRLLDQRVYQIAVQVGVPHPAPPASAPAVRP